MWEQPSASAIQMAGMPGHYDPNGCGAAGLEFPPLPEATPLPGISLTDFRKTPFPGSVMR